MLNQEKAKLQILIKDWLSEQYLVMGIMNKDQLALNMTNAAEVVFDTVNEQALVSVNACGVVHRSPSIISE